MIKKEMLEDVVERSMEALHRELMNGNLTKREYDMGVKALHMWAMDELEKLKRTLQ